MGATLEAVLAATALNSTEAYPLEDAVTEHRPEEIHAVLRSWQCRGWWIPGDLGFLSLGRPTPAGELALRGLGGGAAAAPEPGAAAHGPDLSTAETL